LLPGPDGLQLAELEMTWHRDEAVKIRQPEEDSPVSETPVSVVTALRTAVANVPDNIALGLSLF
jgi:hypothetical protein